MCELQKRPHLLQKYIYAASRAPSTSSPTMKGSVNYTNIGPRLILKSPLTSHVTAAHLLTLPPKTRLKSVYKRLYKLRFLIGESVPQQIDYCNLLRRRFARQDFNLRRNILLGTDDVLSEFEMTQRLANTYAFVFNATCDTKTHAAEINFYEELQQARKPRPEAALIETMLVMEKEMPREIKYDAKYLWVASVRLFYERAETPEILKREVNLLVNLKQTNWIGYLHYERTLAYVNESLQLCL